MGGGALGGDLEADALRPHRHERVAVGRQATYFLTQVISVVLMMACMTLCTLWLPLFDEALASPTLADAFDGEASSSVDECAGVGCSGSKPGRHTEPVELVIANRAASAALKCLLVTYDR